MASKKIYKVIFEVRIANTDIKVNDSLYILSESSEAARKDVIKVFAVHDVKVKYKESYLVVPCALSTVKVLLSQEDGVKQPKPIKMVDNSKKVAPVVKKRKNAKAK